MGRGDPAVLQLVRPAGTEGSQRLPDVRAAHVSASSRHGGVSDMGASRLAAILAAGLLALVAAGCGGGNSDTPQVPGPPAEVAIPESAQAPTAAASANSNSDSSSSDSSSSDSTSSDSSSSSDSTTSGSTGTDTGTDTGDTGSGGSTAP